MKPHVEEAIQVLRVAARDIQAFEVLKAAPEVHISIVCFHAQQATEKSLKAVLFLDQIEFRRTHNLTELARLLRQHKIEIPVTDDQLERLNPFAVTLRYGDDIEIELISRATAAELVKSVYRWAEDRVRQAIDESDPTNQT